MHLPTLILRHKRENLSKCTLRGLEARQDLCFYTYPKAILPPLDSYILLSLNGPVLSKEDRHLGLFLIDGTWRHATTMYRSLPTPHTFVERTLPPYVQTAYPRRQEDCQDPQRGLASVEALYTSYLLLGKDPSGLLDFYYWKELFLAKNQRFFASLP